MDMESAREKLLIEENNVCDGRKRADLMYP